MLVDGVAKTIGSYAEDIGKQLLGFTSLNDIMERLKHYEMVTKTPIPSILNQLVRSRIFDCHYMINGLCYLKSFVILEKSDAEGFKLKRRKVGELRTLPLQ